MRWYLFLAALAVLSKNCNVQCKYQRETTINEKLDFATTTDDFKSLRLHSDDDLYIDKSLFIKEIIESKAIFSVLSRPPKFGKTVTMKMLETFFKIPDDEHERELNRKLFLGGDVEVNGKTKTLKKLKIADHTNIIDTYLGRHPVIYLSFKNCSFHNPFGAMDWVNEKIVDIFRKQKYLRHDSYQTEVEEYLNTTSYTGLEIGSYHLKKLIKYLGGRYDDMVILIDDYDYAINQAFLFHGSKSNEFQRIEDFFESFFSFSISQVFNIYAFVKSSTIPMRLGLTISGDYEFDPMESSSYEYFGFTDEEVDRLLARFPCRRSTNDDIKNHYRGYRVGERIMYNPALILNCLKNDGALLPNVEGVEYLKALDQIPVISTVMGKLHRLVYRGVHIVLANTPEWCDVDNGIFNYLTFTGYLNDAPTKEQRSRLAKEEHNYSISNLATKVTLRHKMVEWISTKLSLNLTDYPNQLQDHLIHFRLHDFTELVEGILQKAAINNLFSGEGQHYIDVLEGFITYKMDYRSYYHSDPITRGERVDIVFAHTSRKGCVLGVILTIHAAPRNNTSMLETIAEQGLQKISKMDYETELQRQNSNIQYILKLSLSFGGQVAEMKCHIEKTDVPGKCDRMPIDKSVPTIHTETFLATTRQEKVQKPKSTKTSILTKASKTSHKKTTPIPETNAFKIFIKSNLPAASEISLQSIDKHLQTSAQNKEIFKQFVSSQTIEDKFNETLHRIRAAIIHPNISISKRSSLRKLGFRIKYGHMIDTVVDALHQLYHHIGLSHILETVEGIFDHSYDGYFDDKLATKEPSSGLKSNSDDTNCVHASIRNGFRFR